MTNITNMVRFTSETDLGYIQIDLRRMKRKDFQKVTANLKTKVSEEGSVQFEIPMEKMSEAVDVICEFLPDYVIGIDTNIRWDGKLITDITTIVEEVGFYGTLCELCMTWFVNSGNLSEGDSKNSRGPLSKESAASDQEKGQTSSPSPESGSSTG